MHAYYYPNMDNKNNRGHEDFYEVKRAKFNSWINFLWMLVFLICYIYIYMNPKFIILKKIVTYMIWGAQFVVTANVFSIVFYSIVGIKKKYIYFSAQHNSMRHLSTMIFLFLSLFPVGNLFLLISKNNSTLLDDFFNTFFFVSLCVVFNFFIICISIFFAQDIMVYIKEKSLYKKIRKKISENFRLSTYIEKLKRDLWKKTYLMMNPLKFLCRFFYSILLLVSYIINIMGFLVIRVKIVRNKTVKYSRKFGISLIKLNSDYIIALSARISVVISLTITYVLFKYFSIISDIGLDVMEFIFTIFLLPVIFNEIMKLRKVKSK
ncbi:hypothetical protein [Enterococcus avium]|uniref:hypothetical protein n=1 Tax=Enterococcus avium TaxID=33945 RepID=UPI0015E6C6C9|nr:hypothetical protein [Enterococcus avium]